jgi:hypothetical protein
VPRGSLLGSEPMRICFLWMLLVCASPAFAAERVFDFGETRENQTPPGFRSAVTGTGKPGEWKVLMDSVPPLLPPLTPQAPSVTKRAVLAQLARDPDDEHFPLFIYENETFGDFTLTTRFKTVSGVKEQMAGIAFRIQNETNYYVVRASSLGNTFRFYKVLNGQRGPLVGPETPIAPGVWHELTVECKGGQIRCLLEGKELIAVTDKVNAFTGGKIGFWTKSDAVSYFTDTRIVYTPFQPPAQTRVRALLKKYPRLLGVEVYVAGKEPETTRLLAGHDEAVLGQPGGKAEWAVLSQGETYYGKDKGSVSVTMPLRDRNGEPIAAVRVRMKSFAGQTEANAVVRAAPIVKELQGGVQNLADLLE